MSEKRLAQEGYGADPVQFMNAVFIPVVIDKEARLLETDLRRRH